MGIHVDAAPLRLVIENAVVGIRAGAALLSVVLEVRVGVIVGISRPEGCAWLLLWGPIEPQTGKLCS